MKLDDKSLELYLGLLLNAGCKMQFKTELFGKSYVWMTDPQGVTFLERIPDA